MEIVKNCSVPNCDGLHNIVFNGERAVITINEFYKIVRHWEQNINNICEKRLQIRETMFATQMFKFYQNV